MSKDDKRALADKVAKAPVKIRAALADLADFCRAKSADNNRYRELSQFMLEAGLIVETQQACPCAERCPCYQANKSCIQPGTMIECYRLVDAIRSPAELDPANRKVLS